MSELINSLMSIQAMIPDTRTRRWNAHWLALAFVLSSLTLFTGACQAPLEVDVALTLVPTKAASPTPLQLPTETPPPKTLIVCLNREPASLFLYSEEYLYGDSHSEAAAVLEAIYDGPWDVVDYQIEPVILERIPDLAASEGARVESVAVREGDVFLNPESLNPEVLQPGKPYLPSGCHSLACMEQYQSGDVEMDRVVATFQLREGLEWSDGELLTASDSVFSFKLEENSAFKTTKYMIDRTFSYVAPDERTVVWTGIPGFLDSDYALNFWTPLPEHVLGEIALEDMTTAEQTARTPLGWGPYRIVEWQQGRSILLEKNPRYFKAAEELPHFDRLLFRFIGDDVTAAAQQVVTQECDLVHDSVPLQRDVPALVELEGQGLLSLASSPSAELTRFDFNVNPPSGEDIVPVFADARLRQALAQCVDRGKIRKLLYADLGVSPDTFLSTVHPRYAQDVDPILFDPASARQSLEALGWVDEQGANGSVRVARGVSGVPAGTRLSFTFLTTDGTLEEVVATQIQSDFEACGAEMRIEVVEPEVLNYPWPDGPVFGRGFETVASVWPDWISPVCEAFASWEIPGDENPFGSNAGGFNDPAYNEACRRILHGPPGSEAYFESMHAIQRIFHEELPSLPLYVRPRILIYRVDACGVQVDATAFSTLWNLENVDHGENCTP